MSDTLRLDHSAACFVCSHDRGIGNQFWYDAANATACSTTTFGQHCQGAPGLAHGGALFAVLDEVMGLACWSAGHRVMSARVTITYRRPVPLDQPVHVKGTVARIDGRKVWTRGEIADAEGLFAEAEGLFVHQDRFDWPVQLVQAEKEDHASDC